MRDRVRIGVVHGRFQPLHLDHLKYILAAAEHCDNLFVGITNPDPELSAYHESDPQRSRTAANPFSYWERLLMIRASLPEAGINLSKFDVVPFPINRPELLRNYVPDKATFYMTIYDEWGHHKRDILLSQKFNVEVLWQRDQSLKGITATMVREYIAAGDDWEKFVPKGTAQIIKRFHLDERIRNFSSSTKK
jgi:cytidyltransferase-like protein